MTRHQKQATCPHNQTLITDMIKKKSKRAHQVVQQREEEKRSSNQDLKEQKTTKKRKRSEFEEAQAKGNDTQREKDLIARLERMSSETKEKPKGRRFSEEQAQKKPKRFKKNESSNPRDSTEDTVEIVNVKKKQELKSQVNSSIQSKKNLGIKQTQALPLPVDEEQKTTKKRGRPKLADINATIQQEALPNRSESQARVSEKDTQNSLSRSKANKRQSSEVREEALMPKDAIVEKSIIDPHMISQLDHTFFGSKSKSKSVQVLPHRVVYQSDEHRDRCNKFFINAKSQIEERPSSSDSDDDDMMKAYEKFLKGNPDVLKAQKELMKRKNRIKEDLLYSECLLPIYRMYEPIKKKKEKLKQNMKQRRAQ